MWKDLQYTHILVKEIWRCSGIAIFSCQAISLRTRNTHLPVFTKFETNHKGSTWQCSWDVICTQHPGPFWIQILKHITWNLNNAVWYSCLSACLWLVTWGQDRNVDLHKQLSVDLLLNHPLLVSSIVHVDHAQNFVILGFANICDNILFVTRLWRQ